MALMKPVCNKCNRVFLDMDGENLRPKEIWSVRRAFLCDSCWQDFKQWLKTEEPEQSNLGASNLGVMVREQNFVDIP